MKKLSLQKSPWSEPLSLLQSRQCPPTPTALLPAEPPAHPQQGETALGGPRCFCSGLGVVGTVGNGRLSPGPLPSWPTRSALRGGSQGSGRTFWSQPLGSGHFTLGFSLLGTASSRSQLAFLFEGPGGDPFSVLTAGRKALGTAEPRASSSHRGGFFIPASTAHTGILPAWSCPWAKMEPKHPQCRPQEVSSLPRPSPTCSWLCSATGITG